MPETTLSNLTADKREVMLFQFLPVLSALGPRSPIQNQTASGFGSSNTTISNWSLHTRVPKTLLKSQYSSPEAEGTSLEFLNREAFDVFPKPRAPWQPAYLPRVFKHLPQPSILKSTSSPLQPKTIFSTRLSCPQQVIQSPTILKSAANSSARHLLSFSISSDRVEVSPTSLFPIHLLRTLLPVPNRLSAVVLPCPKELVYAPATR